MFYSKSRNGFYALEIHGNNIPSDAVEISQENHAALLTGQASGLKIVADTNGYPTLAALEVVACVPASVGMAQAQLALLAAGHLNDVEAAIATMPREAQIRWEKSSTVRRDDALTAALAELLGLDDAALDALFVAAAGL